MLVRKIVCIACGEDRYFDEDNLLKHFTSGKDSNHSHYELQFDHDGMFKKLIDWKKIYVAEWKTKE